MDRGWLFAERRRRLERKIALYREPLSRAEIERIQVERFNRVWAYCLTRVPFYQSWRKEHGLPTGISRPSDLRHFPTLDKELLISRSAEVFASGSTKRAYSTGGSTGQPTRFPRGRGESTDRWANNYLGRAWRGVRPFEPQILLWGHSHLFGDGIRSRIARLQRDAADRLVNITRLNAYDLSDPALRGHYEAIRSRHPVLLVGYTSAIFKVARFIERNGLDLGDMSQLRAVILTAETASDADIAMIERVFGTQAVIEYGAAETGLVAMSRAQARPIHVIWDSFICLIDEDNSLAVTTLDDRLFPLVNYSIGDRVEPTDAVDGNAFEFRSVLGRRQEIVQVASAHGTLDLSPILPVHILKTHPGIVGVQFRQERPDALHIYLQADHELDLEAVSLYFARELRKDHPDLRADSIAFHQVADQTRTRAGKHALFVS
ncbi:phenylacetate--CoA ligase family protein [Micromonospora sp. GCM10011542]|uniref:phenylacetate--CoA ligase family protein n=1 Tax=Micromonospora sp. GCM10011542 TaxID=3317337 RepID=UPI00361E8278